MSAASITALIVAITGLISSVGALIAVFRRVGGVSSKLDTVHGLVNNQLDRQLGRNAELTAALTEAGVDVPKQEPPEGSGRA